MVLTERDYKILREINRWRFLLGRHVKEFCDFEGVRACDKRLRTLMDAGYIDRQKVLYGVPGVYTLTSKGKILLGLSPKKEKIRVGKINHDILMLDSAVALMDVYKITKEDITTEKEQRSKDGFNSSKHYPDFTFIKGHEDKETRYCVEIELTAKAKARLLAILKENYTKYDKQVWIIPHNESRIKETIEKSSLMDIEIIECEVITNYIRNR